MRMHKSDGYGGYGNGFGNGYGGYGNGFGNGYGSGYGSDDFGDGYNGNVVRANLLTHVAIRQLMTTF